MEVHGVGTWWTRGRYSENPGRVVPFRVCKIEVLALFAAKAFIGIPEMCHFPIADSQLPSIAGVIGLVTW